MNKTNLFKALLLALVGGTIAFTACSPTNEPTPNDNPTEEPQERPHHNVELFFNMIDNVDHIRVDTIQKYAVNQYVDTIFMIPDGRYDPSAGVSGMSTELITEVRDFLQKRIDVSRKVRGKGDLWFGVGKALPADSLWFVEHGWTVNQSRQW